MTNGIDELKKIKNTYKTIKADGASQYNPGWHEAIALRNLIITAESVAMSALIREESRGAHTRVDFPGEQDKWIDYNVVIHKGDNGSMLTERRKRVAPDPELVRIANLSINELEREVATKP